jgi:bacterial/archaeal transporter family protein
VSVLGLSLLTMLFWGIAPLFEKSSLSGTSPLTALTIRAVLMAFTYIALAVATGSVGDLFRVDGRSLLYIALSALCGGILGLLLYFHALKLGAASLVVPISASYPLVTVVLAALFLGEPLTATRLLGVALVLAGIYCLR